MATDDYAVPILRRQHVFEAIDAGEFSAECYPNVVVVLQEDALERKEQFALKSVNLLPLFGNSCSLRLLLCLSSSLLFRARSVALGGRLQ